MLLIQIYVDGIIFRFTNESLCKELADILKIEFVTNMLWELNFFLGLKFKQTKANSKIYQEKYTREMVKKLKPCH